MKTKTRQRKFGFTNWGGRRRGAGRKPKGERAGVAHVKRPRLCARHPVLVTMRLREGLASLRHDDAHEVVRRVLVSSSERDEFRVIEYSVQSSHLHLIVEARDERELSRGLRTRVESRAGAQQDLAACREGVLGSLPRAWTRDAAGGARRARVRVAERAQARSVGGARAGSVLVGRGVRGVAGRRGCANKSARASSRADVVALGRMAQTRVDRSARDAGASWEVDTHRQAKGTGEATLDVRCARWIGRSRSTPPDGGGERGGRASPGARTAGHDPARLGFGVDRHAVRRPASRSARPLGPWLPGRRTA